MKKVLIVVGVFVLTGMILVGVVWWYSRTSNPWNAATIGDISTPVGYTRVDGVYAQFAAEETWKQGAALYGW